MISIIIPTLNEESNIQLLLPYLIENATKEVVEIIVVDAGSIDNTLSIAQNYQVTSFVAKKKGRAAQMNEAAQKAIGEILYFIHADTLPPVTYTHDVLNALGDGFPMGCFRSAYDSKHPMLQFNAWMTRFNFNFSRGGDQSFFIKKELFFELNGYKEDHILMEDFEFIIRAKKTHPFKVIPKSVLISTRKYDGPGYFKVNIANVIVYNMYFLGFSQDKMIKFYRKMLSNG